MRPELYSEKMELRLPQCIMSALNRAADHNMCSRSEVARQALLDYLRDLNLIPDAR